MERRNALALLGLDEHDAISAADLRRAYYARARATHPDQGGDRRQFEAATGAYRFLLANGPLRNHAPKPATQRDPYRQFLDQLSAAASIDALGAEATSCSFSVRDVTPRVAAARPQVFVARAERSRRFEDCLQRAMAAV